jgi:hypothetical protein
MFGLGPIFFRAPKYGRTSKYVAVVNFPAKIEESVDQDIWSPDRDSNSGPPK